MITPPDSRSMLMQNRSPSLTGVSLRCDDATRRKYPSVVPHLLANGSRSAGGREFRYCKSSSIPSFYRTVYFPSSNFYSPVISLASSSIDNSCMDPQDVVATRRERLRAIIKTRFGGRQQRMVEEIEINAGELSGLLRKRFFGEKKARMLENALGLPAMWLDGQDGPDVADPDRRELWGKVLWLWNHADPEILTMFNLLIGAMYHKKAQELLQHQDAQRGADSLGGSTDAESGVQESFERGRTEVG